MNSSLGGGSYVSDVSYSPTNQLEQLELSTGGSADKKTWLTYSYEQGTQRLVNARVDVEDATSVAYDADYTYDAGGNVRSVTDNPARGTPDVQCFAYDGMRRMTEAWTSKNAPSGARGTGAPDAACASAPTEANTGGVAPYWNSYGYDVTGNRTTETNHGIGGAATRTKTYTYGGGGAGPHQLTKTVTERTATATTSAVTSQDTHTYDAAGNGTTRVLNGDTQTLDWDRQNKLTEVTEADGSQTGYVYDAAGNRVLRKTAAETTFYLPGMELRLDIATGTVAGTRYYSLGGQTVAFRDADGVTFLAADHHGTAQLAVNAATGQTQRRRLDPFGAGRDTSSSDPSPWATDKGFVGGTIDASTGLTHLGAREYDPSTGRFISADPLIDYTEPQQINGYAYGYNNPLTFADPDGLAPDECIKVGVQCTLTRNGGWDVKPTKTYYTYYGYEAPKPTPAREKARQAQAKADAAKQRAIMAAKELAEIVADELGITDALDCFTTGALGSCGATAVNVVTSFVGGMVGKLAVKYGLPMKWHKAVALGKKLWGLAGKPLGGLRDWWKNTRAAKRYASCEANSFTPGTKVLMADGSTKAIEDVDIGDRVLATDPETGETSARTVTAEIKGKGLKHLVRVTVDLDGKKGGKTAAVTATDGHPFWVPELGEWIDATDLKPGTWLRTSAGTHVQITAVKRWTTQSATVHNLTVDGLHTYYALAGATPVLVHNANCKTVVENQAGRFGDMDPGVPGDGLTPHHMPQDALGHLPRNDGGAIVMKHADHALTRTYGARGRATKAAETGLPFRTYSPEIFGICAE